MRMVEYLSQVDAISLQLNINFKDLISGFNKIGFQPGCIASMTMIDKFNKLLIQWHKDRDQVRDLF